MLATFLNIMWLNQLNIEILRSFEDLLKKAAADIESATLAGFLKFAAIRESIKPEILIFNGAVRKTPKIHFACTVNITRRKHATGEDIRNFSHEDVSNFECSEKPNFSLGFI